MKQLYVLLLFLPFSVFAQETEEIWDPLEPMNRGIFWFNDQLDIYLVEPIAEGYEAALPICVRKSVTNFFENLNYPTLLLSSVIELEFEQAARHTGRFLINSTIGIGGLIDVASEIGLDAQETDFGAAFASLGIPAGPYLVLPILGPSTVRDGLGTAVSTAVDPITLITWQANMDGDDELYLNLGVAAVDGIDTRARLLEAVRAAKDASLDYYLFTQSAYYQYRAGVERGTAELGSRALIEATGVGKDEVSPDEEWLLGSDQEELSLDASEERAMMAFARLPQEGSSNELSVGEYLVGSF